MKSGKMERREVPVPLFQPAEVELAGGRLLRRREFAPGLPCAYVAAPDGYGIEIWFESAEPGGHPTGEPRRLSAVVSPQSH